MIPADVASSLRMLLPDQQALTSSTPQTQPVAPPQRIADALSNFVPGQRLMAEVQSMLPNGTYRAVVGQREITLALPFSAKAGDSLELEVKETDGKLTLAFLANRSAEAGNKGSVATSISQTGKLIGDLLGGIDNEGRRAPAAPLNANQPLVQSMPKTGADLAPVLKQALTQSGVFYEAHQARWVAGQLPTEALRQEPQGRQPANLPPLPNSSSNSPQNPGLASLLESESPQGPLPSNAASVAQTPNDSNTYARPVATNNATEEASLAAPAVNLKNSPKSEAGSAPAARAEIGNSTTPATTSAPSQVAPQQATGIPRELTPIVQQQLDGLATQNFVWQGQAWPGQAMRWEIGPDPDGEHRATGEEGIQWQTRLKLALPMLGGIDAVIRLQPGGELGVSLKTDSATSEARLREAGDALAKQLEAAGLSLKQLLVAHEQTGE